MGVKDADGEEEPKAVVVRTAESVIDGDDVMAFVADQVAPHKKVWSVEFVDAIPKSVSGRSCAGTSGTGSPPDAR